MLFANLILAPLNLPLPYFTLHFQSTSLVYPPTYNGSGKPGPNEVWQHKFKAVSG